MVRILGSALNTISPNIGTYFGSGMGNSRVREKLDKLQPQTDENSKLNNQFVARLMKQIKQASGLSNSELASALHPKVGVTDKMISQYLAGNKPMGKSRLLGIAKVANARGWETEAVKTILTWEEMFPVQRRIELTNNFSKLTKSQNRSLNAALNQFDKCIERLVDLGFDDKHIVGLAALFSEKHVPRDEQSMRGVIDLSKIQDLIGDVNGTFKTSSSLMVWDTTQQVESEQSD